MVCGGGGGGRLLSTETRICFRNYPQHVGLPILLLYQLKNLILLEINGKYIQIEVLSKE